MTPDFRPQQVLHGRFVLVRQLLGGSAQLWTGHDRRLESAVLFRVYSARTVPVTTLEQIKGDTRHYRQAHHPIIARIHDLHEGDDELLVSIDSHEGETLGAVLEQAEPMPYPRVVTVVRPIIEALIDLHEGGGEHGQLDHDHVLVTESFECVVLPGDRTRPPRSDTPQLGHLMAALLTGGDVPPASRELNDLADRLHAGRTVPALLNQLITDLRKTDVALRPANMREVLHRLDQLAEVIKDDTAGEGEDAPGDAPEPVPVRSPTAPPAQVPPVTQAAPRWRPAAMVALILLALVGAVVIVGIVLSRASSDDAVASAPPAEQTPVPADTGTPDSPDVIDAAALAAQRVEAEAALGAYLFARRSADDVGAVAWAQEAYGAATTTASGADQSFLNREYVAAAAGYVEAESALNSIVQRKDDALPQLLQHGSDALAATDAIAAAEAFATALMIAPGHAEARIGAGRAATLDELRALLASGRAHEEADRLAFAHADYATAEQLDPHSAEAAAAYERIKLKLADEAFQAMMSRGLEAYHRGAYDVAETELNEAAQFRPGAPDVSEALAMVAEAKVRAELERLRHKAIAFEQDEQWQSARNTYRQVLAIDPAVEYAQVGKLRSEQMIRLEQHVRQFLDFPDKLIERATREIARQLAAELTEVEGKGPRLQQASDEFIELVRLANVPQRVVLRSDGQTDVDVYRVGQFGTFQSKELSLVPGIYTVVGHRKGYKTVRLTLRVIPGGSPPTLEVVCTESI